MPRFKAFASSDSEDEGSASSSSSPDLPHRDLPVPKAAFAPAVSRPQEVASQSESESPVSTEKEDEDDSEEDDSEDLGGSSEMEEDELTPDDEIRQHEPKSWAKQLDLEPHRVNVMQSSLFRDSEIRKPVHDKANTFLKQNRPADARHEPRPTTNRTSFTQPRARAHPPARKYVRVSGSESKTKGKESVLIDAGLSMGRSFRVGWGPGNNLVHVGQLQGRSSSSDAANSSTVRLTTLQTASVETPDLLQHLLSNSRISEPSQDNDFIPSVIPDRDLTFSSFSSLFDSQDDTHAASVFRLGNAIFDPLELHLGPSVPHDIRNRVTALRRADALSSWLARAVASSVEQDIMSTAVTDTAKIAFLHLTGHQVEKAVDVLTTEGNVRLATLVSQVPGDAEFRIDLRDQLQVWKEEKVDAHMSESIRRLYALTAGEVDVLEGSSRKETIDVAKDLDWMRVLGLQLWYASFVDTPLRDTFETYERFVADSDGGVGSPHPWYSSKEIRPPKVNDGLFNILKLFLSPSMTLESALNPLSFAPNPRDFKLPWFLYVLLSRCLRLRDFTDRQLGDVLQDEEFAMSQDFDGYSQMANALTTNYAAQLQQEGLIQEAAYVLLYLEDDRGRKHAIKQLLAQSAPALDDFKVVGLIGSLRIPTEWVDEAKATLALYHGDIYLAYQLYSSARSHRTAHELALNYLAPEAVLKEDLQMLSDLFSDLDASLIEDFAVGGQLFIDYVHIISRIGELRESMQADAVPDASETSELETLTGRIPKLIGVLPDVLHDKAEIGERFSSAALSHMLSRLLDCVDPRMASGVEIEPGLVDEGARLRHIHASAYGSFMKTLAELS